MRLLPDKVIDSENAARPGSHLAGWLGRVLVFVFSIVAAQSALAQGCAMCYTSAAAAKKAGIQALQNGILVLLIPPLFMFAVIVWHTLRRKDLDLPDTDLRNESDDGTSVASRFLPESSFPGSGKSNSIGVKSFLRE